jgi:VWFA-related protein
MTPVLKVNTRMVSLQIVAHDQQGHFVPGLRDKDFQVFEEVLPKKDKRPQQIAAFQPVSVAAIAATDHGNLQMPPGVVSNLVSMHKVQVPPTVLLIDGINTPLAAQMQVHRQMVKVLGSIPADVPVSVFLLGRRLHLLQDFTTDPKLLIDASRKAFSFDSVGLVEMDPRDDPNSPSAQLEPNSLSLQPGASWVSLEDLQRFERETYASQIDIRAQATLDALRSIARYLAGYPGRKNLLWVSSSFPLQIAPDSTNGFDGMSGNQFNALQSDKDNQFNVVRDYESRMIEVTDALSDAKVAIYPMDPAGLQTWSFVQASNQPRRGMRTGAADANSMQREEQSRFSNEDSMKLLAEGTGGRVCVNNNDLSDCVKKAMDDGSSYYELSYYPDSTNWNGEFHRVVVKTSQPGVHLAYRQGYFAFPDGSEVDQKKRAEKELREAACEDLLGSTSLLIIAKTLPADRTGKAKYFMAIESKRLTFTPADGGNRNLRIQFALCTFDKKGEELQYFAEDFEQKFGEKEYASMAHGLTHVVQFTPDAGIFRLRLVVRDSVTGQMGSVEMPYLAPAPAPDTGSGNP